MINAEDLPPRRDVITLSLDFVDINVSRGLGDKVAFVDPVRELTYGELQTATCRFADALRTLGLRQESRVALLLLDTVEFPIVFWGAIRAGIVPVPLSNQLPTEQYAYILDDCRAEVMLISRPLLRSYRTRHRSVNISEDHRCRRRRGCGHAPLRKPGDAPVRGCSGARFARPVQGFDGFGRGRVLALFLGLDRRS